MARHRSEDGGPAVLTRRPGPEVKGGQAGEWGHGKELASNLDVVELPDPKAGRISNGWHFSSHPLTIKRAVRNQT
jgi:hypothetical protein